MYITQLRARESFAKKEGKKEEKEGRKRGRKEKRKTRNRQLNHNWSKFHAKSAYTSPAFSPWSTLYTMPGYRTESITPLHNPILYGTWNNVPLQLTAPQERRKMFKKGLCETACMRLQTSGLKSRRSVWIEAGATQSGWTGRPQRQKWRTLFRTPAFQEEYQQRIFLSGN